MPILFRGFVCAALATAFLATPLYGQTVRLPNPRPPLPRANQSAPPQAELKPLPPGVVQIQLVELHCKTCARKLAGKLYAVPGVVRVKADLKKDVATVTLQKRKPAAPAKLWDAVIAAKLAPLELRIAATRMTAKDFPKAKKIAKSPHAPSSRAQLPQARSAKR